MSESTPFFDAIRGGDVAAVRAALDADPERASGRDGEAASPVVAAAYARQGEVLAALLERKPRLGAYEAALLGDVDALAAALDADPAAVQRTSPDGFTPLHVAAFFARTETLRLLLARGASVTARSANGLANLPLHAALAGRMPVEGLRLLLDAGAPVDDRQHGGYTALHAAAMHGQDDVVDLLLARGADPSVRTDDGKSAADFAEEGGHAGLAERLRARTVAGA
jgi:ankyrin repeat protein